MQLVEFNGEKDINTELIVSYDKVREYKREQVEDVFNLYSLNSNINLFSSYDIELFSKVLNDNVLLKYYPNNRRNKEAYEDVKEHYLNGDFDKLPVHNFIEDNRYIRHMILLQDYDKYALFKEDIDKVPLLLEISDQLYLLYLLLQDSPLEFKKYKDKFYLSKYELNEIRNLFNYIKSNNELDVDDKYREASLKVLKFIKRN